MKANIDKLTMSDFENDESDSDSFSLIDVDEKLPKTPVVDKTPFVYEAVPNWDVNTGGMRAGRLQKLYNLFFDKSSAFYIGKDVGVCAENPFDDAHCLQSRSNNQQIFLFNPDRKYTAAYGVDSKYDAGSLESSFDNSLLEISSYCATACQPVTFIIPCMEMPNDPGRGVNHNVLLTINYDPKNKQLTPIIYDSIGRDTYSESLSTYLKGKQRTTCDEIMDEKLKSIVNIIDSSLSVKDLSRVSYNHQNRALEGNCGSYTLRTIQEVIASIAEEREVQVPGSSGYITSDSYLTSQHVQEIVDCMQYRTLRHVDIQLALSNASTVPVQLSEFITSLETYGALRAELPEKSRFNFIGYNKIDKLAAVESLTGILRGINNGKEITDSQYDQLKGHLNCLMDSFLGKLVEFHLKNLGFESLEQLVIKPLAIDDFAFIDENDLFDVPDISEKGLASQNTGLPNVGETNLVDLQKQFKNDLVDIRQENEEERDHLIGIKVK